MRQFKINAVKPDTTKIEILGNVIEIDTKVLYKYEWVVVQSTGKIMAFVDEPKEIDKYGFYAPKTSKKSYDWYTFATVELGFGESFTNEEVLSMKYKLLDLVVNN